MELAVLYIFQYINNIMLLKLLRLMDCDHILPTGAEHGLSLTLNVEQYDHTVGSSYDAGIKVVFAHHRRWMLCDGEENWAQIQYKDVVLPV